MMANRLYAGHDPLRLAARTRLFALDVSQTLAQGMSCSKRLTNGAEDAVQGSVAHV